MVPGLTVLCLKNLPADWSIVMNHMTWFLQDDPSLYDYNVQEKVDLFVQYAHNQVCDCFIHCCQIADLLPARYMWFAHDGV